MAAAAMNFHKLREASWRVFLCRPMNTLIGSLQGSEAFQTPLRNA
jgi:hypothetical protein